MWENYIGEEMTRSNNSSSSKLLFEHRNMVERNRRWKNETDSLRGHEQTAEDGIRYCTSESDDE